MKICINQPKDSFYFNRNIPTSTPETTTPSIGTMGTNKYDDNDNDGDNVQCCSSIQYRPSSTSSTSTSTSSSLCPSTHQQLYQRKKRPTSFVQMFFPTTTKTMSPSSSSSYCLMSMLFITILTLSMIMIYAEAKCPSREQSWCLQVDGFDTIVLDGNKFHDLKLVFNKISFLFEDSGENKDVDQLLLINNHVIKSLEPNAFGEFHFRRIVIKNCTNLSHVNTNAFNGTHLVTRSIKFDNIAITDHFQEDFFEALNLVERLEEFELRNHRIHKIRPYTFRQLHLSKLTIDGPLELVENNAFFYLDDIRILALTRSIRHIQRDAFNTKPNNKTLDIYLDAKIGKMEPGVFLNTPRPLTVNLFLSKLNKFDITIFRPLLLSPLRHEIIFHGNPKEMHEPCQLVWLFRQKFRGVFTFKDEPEITENYFDSWQCSHYVDVNGGGAGGTGSGGGTQYDEVPEIDQIGSTQAGIDGHHPNGAGGGRVKHLGEYFHLIVITTMSMLIVSSSKIRMI